MSYANQPARLLISSDDLQSGIGNNFSISLPEAITGATKVDLIRAVVPNTGYNIPDYQNTFYYALSGAPSTILSFKLTNNQYFASLADLITQLKADCIAQSQNIDWSLNPASGTGTGTYRITATYTGGGGQYVIPAVQSSWPTKFALNTRLGYANSGVGTNVISNVGTLLPNLIRSKVLYVLCNVVMNTSISTDGLRTAIAKIPVNSTFGGLTIYNPPVVAWNKLVQSNSYQSINIQLIDDQYQPYPIQKEEFCEFEIAFKYCGGMDNTISE
jgi:hypothetical protein